MDRESYIDIRKEEKRKRKYNVTLYTKDSREYLDYDIIFPGTQSMLIGAIRSDATLKLEGGGVILFRYQEIQGMEIYGGELYEEE